MTESEHSPSQQTLQSKMRFVSARQQRQLRGDLDNIALKALRKEPNRRYASAEQFAEDIRRHLQGLPVTATPDSLSYRARKFVQRHKVGVAASALIVLAVVGGVLATARQARIAEANRRRAEARFNDVRKLANSLIFEVHDSIYQLSGATAARKIILQRALEYLDSLSKESGNEPDLLRELATAYERVGALQGDALNANLGDIKTAAVSLKKSVDLWESLVRINPNNAKDQIGLAVAYLDWSDFQSEALGNISAGVEYTNKAIAILDRLAAAEPTDYRVMAQDTRAHASLGYLEIGNGAVGSTGAVKQGVADLQTALELDHHAIQLSPENPETLAEEPGLLALLGDAMLKLGQRPAALDHYRRAVEKLNALDPMRKRASVAHNAITLDTKIADVFLTEGRVQDAVTWFRKGQHGAWQLSASDASDVEAAQLVITSSGQLGHALIEAGQTGEGLKYLTLALDKIQAHNPRTPLYNVFESIARMWIGEAWERRGRIADALTEYRKSKDAIASARAAGANDLRSMVYYCSSTDRLAAALLKQGKAADAAKEYAECRGILEPLLKANPDNMEVLYALAETYTGEGDVAASLAKDAREPSVRAARLKSASDLYQKSLDTWSKVPNPVRISTSLMEVRVPAEVSRKLAESQALIAARS